MKAAIDLIQSFAILALAGAQIYTTQTIRAMLRAKREKGD